MSRTHQAEYGRATIEFPDGEKILLENVLVTAEGGCRFSLQAHGRLDDHLRLPVKSLGPLGQERHIPPEWL